MSDFRKNQRELDRFFRNIVDGTLTQEQANQQGLSANCEVRIVRGAARRLDIAHADRIIFANLRIPK
jgi:hypothetical protein